MEINPATSYRPDETTQKKFTEEVAKQEDKLNKLAAKFAATVPKKVADPSLELMVRFSIENLIFLASYCESRS